jgi:hypothetical protein
MNTLSRTITGILAIILGIVITISTFYTSFWFLAYGIPIFIAGFFILFNKKEDDIEKIKKR